MKIYKSLPVYILDANGFRWIIKLYVISINNEIGIKINKDEIIEFAWVSPHEISRLKTTPFLDFHFKKAGILK